MAGDFIAEAFIRLKPDLAGFEEDARSGVGRVMGLLSGLGPGSAGVAAAVAGAAAVGGALFGIGERFHSAYNVIRTDTGATGEQLDQLEQSFKKILASGPDAMGAVATAVSQVSVRMKLTGQDLQDFTRTELDLARVTKSDVGATVDATTEALKNFGLASKQQATAGLEELLAASQKTGVSVNDLAGLVVGKAGATFRAFGLDIGASAAVLGSLQAAGVPAASVMVGLQKALVDAQKTGKDARTELTQLFQTLKDGKDGTPEVADAIKTFGARSFETLRDAVRTGKISLDEFNGSIKSTPGSITKLADSNLTLSEAFDKLKNRVVVLLEPLAIRLVEGLIKVVDLISRLPTPVLEGFAIAVGVLTVAWAANAAAAAAAGAAEALAAAPIILVAAAVGGLVYALVEAEKKWHIFSRAAADVGDFFKRDVLPWIKDAGDAIGGVGRAAGDFAHGFAKGTDKPTDPQSTAAQTGAGVYGTVRDAVQHPVRTAVAVSTVAVAAGPAGLAAYPFKDTGVAHRVEDDARSIAGSVASIASQVGSALGTAGAAVGRFAERIGSDVGGGVTVALGAVGRFASRVPGDIGRDVTGALGAVSRFAAELPGRIGYGIGLAIGAIARFGVQSQILFAQTFARVIGYAIRFGPELFGAFERAFAVVSGLVNSWTPRIVSAVGSIFSSAVGTSAHELSLLPGYVGRFLGECASIAGSLGSSIFHGLIDEIDKLPGQVANIFGRIGDAIQSKIAEAFRAVKDFAAGMWQGFKDGLGIHSPSYIERAMETITNNVAGHVQGLRRHVDAVNGYASGLAAISPTSSSAPGAPARAMAAQAAPGGDVHITIVNPTGETTETSLHRTMQKIRYHGLLPLEAWLTTGTAT